MQAGAPRCVSSSELYSGDEVELLLEEIRELEPTSCRGEELQDFEIAGSGAGAAAERSPAHTPRSWDSHAHYSRRPAPAPRALAPLYCRPGFLRSPQGLVSLVVALCSLGSCGCVWAGVGLRSATLPHGSRLQLLLFATFTSAMIHTGLLFMHISKLTLLMPIDWSKLGCLASAWSGASLLGGAAAVLRALLAPEYRGAPPPLRALLCVAAGLGLGGGCVALALAGWLLRRQYVLHAARAAARAGGAAGAGGAGGSRRASAGSRGAYRAVPPAPHDPL